MRSTDESAPGNPTHNSKQQNLGLFSTLTPKHVDDKGRFWSNYAERVSSWLTPVQGFNRMVILKWEEYKTTKGSLSSSYHGRNIKLV